MKVETITLVVPCYNEAECLREFYQRVAGLAASVPEAQFEFIFVDDGSEDATGEILDSLADNDSRVKVLHLARNMGHQIALTAGLDFARGDMIVTIDADLQDPPELIPAMKVEIEQGCAIVHAQRRTREGETAFKLATAWIFYKLMSGFGVRGLIENTGDFRAFTRQVLEVVGAFREKHRFLRGIFATLGFRQCVLQYDRVPRFAGQTKYPFRKMLRLATDAALSFSSTPLRLITWSSVLLWTLSLIYALNGAYDHFVLHATTPGWTSVIVTLTFSMGLVLFCLAIIGSYLGRVFDQIQGRPLYWLSDWRNLGADSRKSPGVERPGRNPSEAVFSERAELDDEKR